MPVTLLPRGLQVDGRNPSILDLAFSLIQGTGSVVMMPKFMQVDGRNVRLEDLLYTLVLAGAAAPGSGMQSGAGDPASGDGEIGDWYLNSTSLHLFEKTDATTWTDRGQLVPP